jgi:hypothetical protein
MTLNRPIDGYVRGAFRRDERQCLPTGIPCSSAPTRRAASASRLRWRVPPQTGDLARQIGLDAIEEALRSEPKVRTELRRAALSGASTSVIATPRRGGAWSRSVALGGAALRLLPAAVAFTLLILSILPMISACAWRSPLLARSNTSSTAGSSQRASPLSLGYQQTNQFVAIRNDA